MVPRMERLQKPLGFSDHTYSCVRCARRPLADRDPLARLTSCKIFSIGYSVG